MLADLNLGRIRRLPIILAAESSECGLACLTMVANYWGHKFDLNGLRQRFQLSIAGATLRSIMDQANGLSLSTRALRVELESLTKVKLPAILHWDLNHFVVLKKIDKKFAVIHDPALGRRRMPISEFSEHFTGVALELTPSKEFQAQVAVAPTKIQDLWSHTQGFWGALGQILVLSIALQVVVFAAPFQMQLVVDEAISRNDLSLLTVLAFGFGTLIIIQSSIEALRSWTISAAGHMVSFQLVGNIVRHLIRLTSDWYEKRHVGDILSRVQSTQPIQDAITRGAIAGIIDGAMGLIAGIVLFLYSPILAFVVLGALLLSLMLSLSLYPVMRSRLQESIIASAKEQSFLMESIRASTTIKIMGREAEREASWRNLFADTINATFSAGKFQIGLKFGQTILYGLQSTIVIFLASRMILNNEGFSVGMLFAFMSFRSTFTDRISALIDQLIQFRLLSLHLDRLGDIVQATSESTEVRALAAPPAGKIELRAIKFRYGAADRLVLDNLDLRIEAGEFIAISGPSGSGKSTLCKLILGLYPPTEGTILLDGLAASDDLWRAWRQHVGVVAQDDRLVSGSIADNIAFFDPDMSMEMVQAAAIAARVHDDIIRMPMQYLSLVGDMGSTLSGGQRQRVLLARALYRQPRILVLDEGTANLDPETEAEITELIVSLPITRVIIAHRPALINAASRHFVVDLTGIREVDG